jgi:hypothetical protein
MLSRCPSVLPDDSIKSYFAVALLAHLPGEHFVTFVNAYHPNFRLELAQSHPWPLAQALANSSVV